LANCFEGRSEERLGYQGGSQGSYDTQGRESGGQNQSYYGDQDGNTQDSYSQGANYDERQEDGRQQSRYGGNAHSGK